MFIVVLIISMVSISIGSITFAILNKKSSLEISQERNKKLITYVIIVFGLYTSIAFIPIALYVITSAIIIIALREILSASAKTKNNYFKVITFTISIPIFYFFAQFIKTIAMPIQLFTYFIVVHFDGFSQVFGESFGKHRLLPKVSPQKTWEGFLGGLSISLFLGIIVYWRTALFRDQGEAILFTGLIVLAAFIGDVLGSWFKRVCGIKNYSNLLPGHGGILDRFDSFFMAGAIIQVVQNIYTP